MDNSSDIIEIVPFSADYIDDMYAIETQSFSVPWSKQDILKDALENKLAIYIVALLNKKVAGYMGLWHVVTEGHITNIAVDPFFRGKGIGQKLLSRAIEIAEEKEMIGLTLEVRMNNTPAQRLYTKNGFMVEGLRKNYYSDTKEDALIMWRKIDNPYC
ncbi:MAG: ribosomal protein S18-alanine N-acetyltransferase [Clostridiales bacterium]|jgi:ribosomal-protein-alanine N-acetyltransferase|nr:ribosomal protein S18-alanine N-acetyltransferase [Clostridiales bacterium]